MITSNQIYHGRFTDPEGTHYTGDILIVNDQETRHGNGKDVYNDSDNSVYVGSFQNDQKHGYGNFMSNEIDYSGDYKNNLKEGDGCLIFNDHDLFVTYVGQFFSDHLHGVGTMRYRDGSNYEGGWAKGKRDGKGVFTFSRARIKDSSGQSDASILLDRFSGSWSDNKKHGLGTLFFRNGAYLEGEWHNDKIKSGTLTFNSNHPKFLSCQNYICDLEENHFPLINPKILSNNHYKITYRNSPIKFYKSRNGIYSGYLKYDQRHGFGTFICDDYKYEGNFFNDVMHGYGEYKNLIRKSVDPYNFESYKGYFKKGRKHSQKGELTFYNYSYKLSADDFNTYPLAKYEGSFVDNQIQGFGTLTANYLVNSEPEFLENEEIRNRHQNQWYIDEFGFVDLDQLKNHDYNSDNNCKNGIVKLDLQMLNPKFIKYVGPIKDCKPHGSNGTIYYPDNKIFRGSFHNGCKNGEGSLLQPDGSQSRGYWVQGELEDNLEEVEDDEIGSKILGGGNRNADNSDTDSESSKNTESIELKRRQFQQTIGNTQLCLDYHHVYQMCISNQASYITKGGFGHTLRSFDNNKKCSVVIKKLKGVTRDLTNFLSVQQQILFYKREIDFMARSFNQAKYCNILELYGYSFSDNGDSFYLVLEDGNVDLKFYLSNQHNQTENHNFQETLNDILRQVIRGISDIHSANIIHRDIKPENILVIDKNGSITAKITDFGIATNIHQVSSSSSSTQKDEKATSTCKYSIRIAGIEVPERTIAGTKHFMAPEISYGCYNETVDNFSWAVTVYESHRLAGYIKFEERLDYQNLMSTDFEAINDERLAYAAKKSFMKAHERWSSQEIVAYLDNAKIVESEK